MQAQSLCVIGLGYIGLPTATMFARAGLTVTGVDIDPRARTAVAAGKPHIEEPGLADLVHSAVTSKHLAVAEKPVPSDAFIIAVPTPHHHDTHQPDMHCVQSATASIAPVLRKGCLVILESTSPVGSTQAMAEQLAALRPDLSFPQTAGENADVQLAYCPERIIPGHMLHELIHNDRIVGGLSANSTRRAANLYRLFVHGEILKTTAATAEMVKLTENSYRDVNIAFANELSMICSDLAIDPWEVIRLANHHPRVKILNPGPGVGGHCIAVDPWFIVATAPKRARLIRTAREVNDAKPLFVLGQVAQAAKSVKEPRILCLGLTYKPDVDDFRESPALEIAQQLTANHGSAVRCVDPFESALRARHADCLGLNLTNLDDGLAWANIIVILVGHTAFSAIAIEDGVQTIDTVGMLTIRQHRANQEATSANKF